MKHCRLLWLIALTMMANFSMAQSEVSVILNKSPRAMQSSMPTSVMSYVNGPMEYLSVNLINNTTQSMEVYLSFQLTTSSTVNGQAGVYIGTRENESFSQISHPLTLRPGMNRLDNPLFMEHFSHRLITNYNSNNLNLNSLTLPEGQYQLCVTVYGESSLPVSTNSCMNFDICYSGSAPEFTSPLILTNNSSFSLRGIERGIIDAPSINKNQYGYIVPTGITNFAWTGVISNCFRPNAFNYQLKFVEVFPNQNPRQAINSNPVIAAINCGHRTYYSFNHLRDRNLLLDSGHVYAMVVTATPSDLNTVANLSNDGVSEMRVFEWRGPNTTPIRRLPNRTPRIPASRSDNTLSNQEQVLAMLHAPKFTSPTSSEQLPASNSLEVKWNSPYHDSILNASYTVKIYEHVGDLVATKARGPIRTAFINGSIADDYSQARTLEVTDDWTSLMQNGLCYFLELESSVDYKYLASTTTTNVETVDGQSTTTSLTTHEVRVANTTFTDTLSFYWGIDSGMLARVIPAQFVLPTNESTRSWDDTTSWDRIPTVTKYQGFKFSWIKPKNVSNLDSVVYDLYVCKLAPGKDRNKASKDTLFVKRNLTETQWVCDSLCDSLKIGSKYLAYVVTRVKNAESKYEMLNGGRSLYSTFALVAEDSLTGMLDSLTSCFPHAVENLDKTVITPEPKQLIDNRTRIHMGEFEMVMTDAKLDKDKQTYKGSGFVVWKPIAGYGGIGIRVDFDSVQLNKDYYCLKGSAAASGKNNESYIKIGIGNKYTDDVDQALTWGIDKLKDVNACKDWVSLANKAANPISEMIRSGVEGTFNVGVTSMPICLPDEIFGNQHQYVKASINDMFFTPTTALMNLVCVFNDPEENIYIPLMATNICVAAEGVFSLHGDNEAVTSLVLASDFEIPLPDGYTMRLKKPSKLNQPTDGTYMSFTSNKFKDLSLSAELDFGGKERSGNQLLAVDMKNNGNVKPNTPVQARFSVKITEWKDWIATLYMDPFTVEGATDWTFVPTGKGMLYDHSTKSTPQYVSFPKNYFGTDTPGSGSKGGKTQGQNGKDNGKDDQLKKATNEWTGFYLDEFKVLMPSSIATTFGDLNDDEKPKRDSIFTYSYGINGEQKDSTLFEVKDRMSFGAKRMIIDKDGFTTDIYAAFNFKAATKKAGGWMFGLDSAQVCFTKNKYTSGSVSGQIGLPLFSSRFNYKCVIYSDSLEFAINHTDKDMKLDIWLAYFKLDKSSHFTVNSNFNTHKTKVDLTINGNCNIDFKNLGIPVDFAGVKVEDMHIRNFRDPKANPEETLALKGDDGDFDFSIGKWSKASPQHFIGGEPSTRYGSPAGNTDALLSPDDNKPIYEGKLGGFTFTVDKISPILDDNLKYSGYKNIGLNFVGGISLGIGGSDEKGKDRTISAKAGFDIYCPVNMKSWDVKTPGGNLDSIRVTCDMDMFSIDGMLGHVKETKSTNTNNGWYGSLMVKVMEVVEVKMAAGFGSSTDNGRSYDWWYFEGAAKFDGSGIPLGVMNLTGLGGGFAYNMELKDKNVLNKKAFELIKGDGKKGGSFTDKMVSSGMSFTPSRNSWLAKAGLSYCLADPNAMNGDGMLTLAIENGHFSRIIIDADAYILTSFGEKANASADSKNSNTLINAKLIMGYEQSKEKCFFKFSLCAKSDIDLKNLLVGKVGDRIPKVKQEVNVSFGGKNLTQLFGSSGSGNAAINVDLSEEELDPNKFGAGIKMMVPIDFEFTYYRKAQKAQYADNGNLIKKAKAVGDVDWYLAIGRPEWGKRVSFDAYLDLKIVKASCGFTFYLLTGNSFDYSMPPIHEDVSKFLFGKAQGEKVSSDKLEKGRTLDKQWSSGAFADAGGFAIGASLKTEFEISMFLYLNAKSVFGFDCGMFDVKGQKCSGYGQIGKNNFYALGQVYGMFEGSVGLKINLGFWKGKFELFSAGMGALLQGGGPNPTWAYGLVRLKARLLNGLIKLNTSIDISLGDVCVPGAGDPLANVKLFQSVTPSYNFSEYTNKENIVQPDQSISVTSNMPWSTYSKYSNNGYFARDVVLVTPTSDGQSNDARRFRFVMREEWNTHKIWNGKDSWVAGDALYHIYDPNDPNTLTISSMNGNFEPNQYHHFNLYASAFEKRQRTKNKNYAEHDMEFNLCTMSQTDRLMPVHDDKSNNYAWGYPLYDGRPKPWTQDTSFYLKTASLSSSINNSVLFTWPYNGDPLVPYAEVADYAYIFLYGERPDLFDRTTLAAEGKELRVFLVNQEQSIVEGHDCQWTYYKSSNEGGKHNRPYIKVKLDPKVYKAKNSDGTYSPCYITMMVVPIKQYQNELEALRNQAKNVKLETQKNGRRTSGSTIWERINAGSTTSGNVNLSQYMKNKANDAAHDDITAHGSDTLMSYLRRMSSPMMICKRIGTPVYTLYFRLDHENSSYSEVIGKIANESKKTEYGIGNNARDIVWDRENAYNEFTIPAWTYTTYHTLKDRSYLFYENPPLNTQFYRSTIKLPAIAHFVIDPVKTIDATYNKLAIPTWLAINEALYFQYNKYVIFNKAANYVVAGGNNYKIDTRLVYDWNDQLSKIGYRLDYNQNRTYIPFTLTTLNEEMLYGGGRNCGRIKPYENVLDNGRNRDKNSLIEWIAPNILTFSGTAIGKIDSTLFASTKRISHSNFLPKNNHVVKIRDYTIDAVIDDSRRIAKTFETLRGYSTWFSETKRQGYYDMMKKSTNHYLLLENKEGAMPYQPLLASLLIAHDCYSDRRNTFIKNSDKVAEAYWYDYWFEIWRRSNKDKGNGFKKENSYHYNKANKTYLEYESPWFIRVQPEHSPMYNNYRLSGLNSITYRYITHIYYTSCSGMTSERFVEHCQSLIRVMLEHKSSDPMFYHNKKDATDIFIDAAVNTDLLRKTSLGISIDKNARCSY